MATQNQVNIGINVSDNGTAKKTVKNLEEITKAANTAQRAASNINTPAGGTAGSRAAFAKAAPSGSQAVLSGEEYGRGRGSMGATGASARDFANQAQGLGGLVRLYATFAANVFAASAAFTALKNAADTANLVRGLDTLGAASGQALGSLSKRLVEVTDGAVSMREAMTATAQASSAGMSGKNIERLALVAKNASLALGVAMPDALNRLSRGIVKLEPELLDELGLFTKIGPATEKYALEIGKSANALTDFERRQAFANAVLEEGEKKFGALAEAAANPYDKLLANLKNVLQSGGELINKVLVPIVSLLAESPTALAGVLAGIGYVLLKQALPAIGQLRAGLRNTAEEALKSAEAFKASFGDEFQTLLEKRFKLPDLQAGLKKAEDDLAKLKVPSKLAGSVVSLASGEDTSIKNIERVKDVLERKNLTAEKGMRGSKQASEAQIEQAKQEVAYINAVIAVLKQKQALEAADTGAQGIADIPPGRWDTEVIALQKYDKLRTKVDQANAISNAAQNAGIGGVRTSWGLLREEVAEKNIKGFTKYSTLAQGGLAAIGTRVMGIIGSLGNLGLVISVVTGTFALLNEIFSKNAKQAETFNKALGTSEESIANVTRTLQAATTVEGFGSKTIANTAALSNAFNELTSSAKEALKTEKAAADAASGWDKFWNGVFRLAGKDRSSKLADSIAQQISSSIDILSREGLADEYSAEIKKILNVNNLKDIDSVARAWKNLSKDQKLSVIAIQENSNRALGNASSALQGFKDKTDNALTAYKAFTNSFVDSSPLFKLGEAYIEIGQSLAQVAAAGPNRIAQAFEELANNSQKAALFGKDFVKAFAPIAEDFKKQKAALDALNISLEKQVEARKNLSSASRVLTTDSGAAIVAPNMGARTRQNSEIANENIRLTNRAIATINTDLLQKGTTLITDAAKKAVDTGLALINRSIANARTTADINISKVLSSVLTGPRKLEAENEIRQRELKLQLEDVKISESLINIQSSLVDEMKLANALQAEANALQKGDKSAIERTALDAQRAKAAVGQTEGIDPKILAEVAKQQEENSQRRTKSLQSKKIAITGEMQASTLSTQLQMPGANLQQQEQLAKITDRKLAAERASLDVLSSIATVTSNTTILAKQSAEASAIKRSQDSEIATINKDIETVELAKSKAKAQDIPRLTKELEVLDRIKKETQEAQKAENNTTGVKNRQELLSQELRDIDKRYESLKSTTDLENQTALTRLDNQSQLLNLQASANQYSQEYTIGAQSALDKEKAFLEASIAREQAEDLLSQKREASQARITALRAEGAEKNKVLIDAETAELTRQEALTINTVTGIDRQYTSKVALLDKTKEINLEQARYNELLDGSTRLAESLGNVFGDLGTKLGSLTTALVDIAVSSEKGAKALADLEFDRDAENDPIKRLALQKEVLKQQDKNTRSELAGNAKIAGAAKSLFKEKTVAYKAFAAVEKGLQIASLAMELKTSIGKISAWWTEVSAKAAAEAALTGAAAGGAAARAPLTFGEIVGNYMRSIPPPWGTVAGFAAGALFLSLLGKSGGSKGSQVDMTGLTSADRQETQGTGQSWQTDPMTGKRVKTDTGGGVFGDSEAKSTMIVDSLAIMKANSIEGLDYDNRMLKALEKLAESVTGAAKSLYSIPGIRQGTNFGTQEGSSSSGGFGSDIPIIGKLLGSIFGGGTSSSSKITSAGIMLKGSFDQVMNDTAGSIMQYKDVLTQFHEDGGWFSSDSDWSTLNTETQALRSEVSKSISDIFKDANDLFVALGEKTGVSKEAIASVLKGFDLSMPIDIMNLKGQELIDELNGVIGAKLSEVGRTIFTGFDAYKNIGEDYLTTVIRVVDGSNKVNMALSSIGKKLPVVIAGAAQVPQALIDAQTAAKQKLDAAAAAKEAVTTGTGKGFFGLFTRLFVNSTEEVAAYNAALTEYEQASKQVNAAQAAITKASFDMTEALIKGAGGLENFMAQADYFAQNFLTDAERLAPIRASVSKEMLRLGISLNTSKDDFKKLVLAQDLSTVAGRSMYQSLMELAPGFNSVIEGITEGLESQRTALEGTVSAFSDFAKNMRTFREGMILSSASIATPAEKLAAAQTQFDAVYAKALTGDRDAMGKVTGAAQTLLDQGKALYASSDEYSKLFNYVSDKTSSAEISALASVDVAQLQLTAINTQVTLLTSIDSNIAAIAGVPQAASGGRVSGLTMVGELGPELVDFTSPGQVYTADQTAGMFAPKAGVSTNMNQVVQELRQVREEIAQLRKDQQQQTGDLIVSNYDANQKASEDIATAVVSTSKEAAWADRSKAEIK